MKDTNEDLQNSEVNLTIGLSKRLWVLRMWLVYKLRGDCWGKQKNSSLIFKSSSLSGSFENSKESLSGSFSCFQIIK